MEESMTEAAGSIDWGPPTPGHRTCCMLAEADPRPWRGNQVLDPANLGPHNFGRYGTIGYVYTCLGGFIDFGHVRDLIDLTYYYVVYLTKRGVRKVNGVIRPFEMRKPRQAAVTVIKDIPDADLVKVAQSMAFDESVAHEIAGYWKDKFYQAGQHASSFSPEDLVSNFIGTYVGGKAFEREDVSFDRAATEELNNVMTLLQARTRAQTTTAFVFIKAAGWHLEIRSLPDYLQKRNFNYKQITPCFLPGAVAGCSGTPSFPLPTGFPGHIGQYYRAQYDAGDELAAKIGTPILRKEGFDAAIAQIKVDAQARYQAGFECGA
jgi:Protein of unknown function (DUF4056)